MKREILKNQNTLSQMDVSPSDAALYVNGLLLDMEYTTIFTLLDHIRSEDRVIGGLHKLGECISICSLLYFCRIELSLFFFMYASTNRK